SGSAATPYSRSSAAVPNCLVQPFCPVRVSTASQRPGAFAVPGPRADRRLSRRPAGHGDGQGRRRSE
ncbi:hypothetical protein AB0L05_41830, partial [Nonomuraea pusilla]|uniref:hypothetical protein n=1 Tax=Nonomuraea pusilla TaxID=46177 RepID=UPI00342F1579